MEQQAFFSIARDKKTKWQGITEDIKDKFQKNMFLPGDSFYSLKDICKIYNVSEITARRVFQELKREGLISPTRRRGTVVSTDYELKEIFLAVSGKLLEGQTTRINVIIYN